MSPPAQPESLPAWRTIKAQLRNQVGESQYEIWLAGVQLRAWDGERLVLAAPAGTRGWVADRFGPVIRRCACDVLGDRIEVILDPGDGEPSTAGPNPPSAPAAAPTETFNPRYSFDQFIIGHSNRLAHAAALAVAEFPGQAYNPLFLHAPPGHGKTHLLHAIGNYVLAYGGGAKVRYTTAEAFTNHFLSALSTRSLDPFKRAYRDADVLLIDDVQFLASKARTEEEFFHTFNTVYESGRQLVLTCDRLPRSLTGIEARLRERFEAGLVADMGPPDHATRVAILRKRAALDGVRLSEPAVLDLIASRVTTNIRALEGALIRVVAYHSLTQRPIDIPLAREVMDAMYPRRGSSQPTVDDVKRVVAERFALSTTELVSPTRTARIAWPRQLAIHLARELTGASLQAIGDAFGGRNHATVLHACKRVSQRLAEDDNVAHELDSLTQRIDHQQDDRDD
ncbi:MAG: chromosomal replication initiator protein [Solirubrobacteraceae bacterium]|nr:chromosomal replication initiator protein [Solirubrobacteraceae bacterium]